VGRSAWHNAAYGMKLDVMKNIWEMAKERLKTEEIQKEMLLRTDIVGRTPGTFQHIWAI